MSAGKPIAPCGAQHTCQLTGWAAPDLTAKCPDEFLNRAWPHFLLMIGTWRTVCCLADPRPPPPPEFHILFSAHYKRNIASDRDDFREHNRQPFSVPACPAGGDAGGFWFNPMDSELGRVARPARAGWAYPLPHLEG